MEKQPVAAPGPGLSGEQFAVCRFDNTFPQKIQNPKILFGEGQSLVGQDVFDAAVDPFADNPEPLHLLYVWNMLVPTSS
ncbi:MAG: hypothetical protein HY881_15850 [Deltaproteobacteria bacterium]|nr:hypothetical protein [Deltaproteobacteria bacterium]